MKIEQWVEDQYNWINGTTENNNYYTGWAFVWLNKAMYYASQYDAKLAHEIEWMRRGQKTHNEQKVIDLHAVLYLAHKFNPSVARDLLRKLIVWCAVYHEVV